MSTIPPIQVQVTADTTGLKTGLEQAKTGIRNIDDSVKTANTGMANFTANLKKVGAALGVTFAAAKIADFAKDSIMASSNMAESLSKVQVVFGDAAGSVVQFSKTSAESMGMSSQAALEAAGTYGNLFQALGVTRDKATEMSTGLVSLAADLGSFNNMSTTDSLNALRSGLSGETEPLKRFGIALNDVTLKNKAMEMGFGRIKGVMDPAIKAQVTYALVLEQTKLAQGDYARTADGAANTMKSLQAQFENAKVAVGDALMPAFRLLLGALKVLIPLLEKTVKFFKDNADALKMLTIIVAAATAVFYAYRAAVIVTTAVTAIYTAVVKAQAAGFTIAQLAAFNLKVAIFLLNNAMRANPIGLIVTALALLAAGFVIAWKKSETFRGIVIKGVQIILNGFALLVQGIGKFLGMLGKVPGMGWAKGIAEGADKAANSIKATAKNLSDLKSSVKAGYGEGAFTYGSGKPTGTTDTTTTTTSGEDEKKKRLEKLKDYSKKVKDIYKDMNEVIADAQERAGEALANRDEKIADARERAKEQEADLRKNFNEAMAAADERYLEATAEAYERQRESKLQAEKRFADAELSIKKDYAKKAADLEEANTKKLATLRENAAKKSIDLQKNAAEKESNIIKQSIDRLRSAFASGTGFSIAEAFKGKGAGGFLETMKKQLADAKALQEGAAYLSGQGYAQTFIEEIVKAGPAAGLDMINELKKASPEQQKVIRETFMDMEAIQETGLDKLAASMNNGANLATSQLREAYDQVAVDLKESLATVDVELQKSLAEANAAYAESMAEAKILRDEKLMEASNQLAEAIAAAKTQLDESLADADKALKKSQKEAQKNLSEGLAEVQQALQKALLDAQKDYEKAIDDINKSTIKKIEDLKAKLAEVAALMAALGAAQAAAAATANAPKYTPIVAASGVTTATSSPTTNTTVNITGVNLTDPNSTSTQVINAIRFGNVVVPTAPSALASGESGAIGAASIKARTTSALSSAQIVANRRQAQGGYL
jgi:hypothetical protein